MSLIRVCAAIAAVAFIQDASAVTVKGDVACSQWNSHRDAYRQSMASQLANPINPDTIAGVSQSISQLQSQNNFIHDESWLFGFLSGVAAGTKMDVLSGVESEAIDQWVDGYCQQQPLDYLDDAGRELIRTLKSRQR